MLQKGKGHPSQHDLTTKKVQVVQSKLNVTHNFSKSRSPHSLQLSAVGSNDDLNHELTSPLPQLTNKLQKCETPKSQKKELKSSKSKSKEKPKFSFQNQSPQNSRNVQGPDKETTPMTMAIENSNKQSLGPDDIKASNQTILMNSNKGQKDSQYVSGTTIQIAPIQPFPVKGKDQTMMNSPAQAHLNNVGFNFTSNQSSLVHDTDFSSPHQLKQSEKRIIPINHLDEEVNLNNQISMNKDSANNSMRSTVHPYNTTLRNTLQLGSQFDVTNEFLNQPEPKFQYSGQYRKNREHQMLETGENTQIEVQIKSSLEQYKMQNPEQYVSSKFVQRMKAFSPSSMDLRSITGQSQTNEQFMREHDDYRTRQLEMINVTKNTQGTMTKSKGVGRAKSKPNDIKQLKTLNKRTLQNGRVQLQSQIAEILSQSSQMVQVGDKQVSAMLDQSFDKIQKTNLTTSSQSFGPNASYLLVKGGFGTSSHHLQKDSPSPNQTIKTQGTVIQAPSRMLQSFDNSVSPEGIPTQVNQGTNVSQAILKRDNVVTRDGIREKSNENTTGQSQSKIAEKSSKQILIKNQSMQKSEMTQETLEHKSTQALFGAGSKPFIQSSVQVYSNKQSKSLLEQQIDRQLSIFEQMERQAQDNAHQIVNQYRQMATSKKKKLKHPSITRLSPDSLKTKFHSTKHTWRFTLQPPEIKDVELNPKKYYKDKILEPALRLKFEPKPVVQDNKISPDQEVTPFNATLFNNITGNKMDFKDGQLLNPLRRKQEPGPEIFTYRDRQEQAKVTRRERIEEQKAYRAQVKAQTKQFKEMMRNMNMGDQVSDTGSDTVYSESVDEERPTTFEFKVRVRDKDEGEADSLYHRESMKEIKNLGKEFGKHIHENFMHLVPQRGPMKKPYGEPIMLPIKADTESPIRSKRRSESPIKSIDQGLEAMNAQFLALNKHTYRFKQEISKKGDKLKISAQKIKTKKENKDAKDKKEQEEEKEKKPEEVINQIAEKEFEAAIKDEQILEVDSFQPAKTENKSLDPRSTDYARIHESSKSEARIGDLGQMINGKENIILNSHDSDDSAEKFNTQQPFKIAPDVANNANDSIYDVNIPDDNNVGRNTAYIVNSPSRIFSNEHVQETPPNFQLPQGQSRHLPQLAIQSSNQQQNSFDYNAKIQQLKSQTGLGNIQSHRGIDSHILAHDSTRNTLSSKKSPAFLQQYSQLKATNSTQYAFQASEKTKRNFIETSEKLGISLPTNANASSPIIQENIVALRNYNNSSNPIRTKLNLTSNVNSNTSILPQLKPNQIKASLGNDYISTKRSNQVSQSLSIQSGGLNYMAMYASQTNPVTNDTTRAGFQNLNVALKHNQSSAQRFNASCIQSPNLKNQYIRSRQILNKSVQCSESQKKQEQLRIIQALSNSKYDRSCLDQNYSTIQHRERSHQTKDADLMGLISGDLAQRYSQTIQANQESQGTQQVSRQNSIQRGLSLGPQASAKIATQNSGIMNLIANQLSLTAKNMSKERVVEDPGPTREERYQIFKKEKEERGRCADPLKNKDRYAMSTDVAETIEMADFMVQYNCEQNIETKLNEEFGKKFVKPQQRSPPKLIEQISLSPTKQQSSPPLIGTNSMYSPQKKIITIKRTLAKQPQPKMETSRSKSSICDSPMAASISNSSESESEIDPVEEVKKKPKAKKQRKMPSLCTVEQIALKFMYDIYDWDKRFEIDQDEQDRLVAIRNALENRKNEIKSATMETQSEHEQVHQKKQDKRLINCGNHGMVEEDLVLLAEQQFNRFKNFYTALMDTKHNKVAQEKLCATFLEVVMNPKEKQFAALRKRILTDGLNDPIQKLRELNPQVFIKEDMIQVKKEKDAEEDKQTVETMDTRAHHQYSFIPNRKIYANREIMDTLVKSMIDAEYVEKKRKVEKPDRTNPFIADNIKRRQYEKTQEKVIKQAQKQVQKAASPQGSKGKGFTDMFNKQIMKEFNQQLNDYMHFSSATKQDLTQRVSSKDIAKMLNSQIQDSLKQVEGQSSGLKMDAIMASFKEGMQKQTTKIAKIVDGKDAESNPAISDDESINEQDLENQHRQQIFKKELEEKRFYKHIGSTWHGNTTPAILFYRELRKQNCVQIPEFAQIQDHTLSLNSIYMNSETIHALANYIIAQTRIQAIPNGLETEEIKCEPSQYIVKHLIVDDCGMKDQDFAILLGAISLQGKLKSLTYANCEFGWKSLTALCAVLQDTTPTSVFGSDQQINSTNNSPASSVYTKKEPIECLKLINLKTEKEILLRLFTELDEQMDINPLKQLKLSGLDLNHIYVIEYLKSYLSGNQNIKELDLSNIKIASDQLRDILETLAERFTASDQTIELNDLNLSYNSIGVDEEQIESIVQSICCIIDNAQFLTHLDLSGMNLGFNVKPIVQKIVEAENQILVSLHLDDNAFDSKTKDWIIRKLGVDTQNYHKLQCADMAGLDAMEHAILTQTYQQQTRIEASVHKLFKPMQSNDKHTTVRQEASYLNNQIVNELKQVKHQVAAGQRLGGFRDHNVIDPISFTRKIGHPELIFNTNNYCLQEYSTDNADGKWSYHNSTKGDDCYVCQKHSYLQIFYRRSTARLDFQKLEDEEVKQTLIKAYNLNNEACKTGSPIFMSSGNKWILTRLLDVTVFAQLLKGQNDDFIKASIKRQQKEYKERQEKMKEERELAREKAKQELKNLGADPILLDTPAIKIRNLKEEIKKDTVEFFEAEMKRVKMRSKNITRSISGIGGGIGGSFAKSGSLSEDSIKGSIAGALKEALSPGKRRQRPKKLLSLAHQETFNYDDDQQEEFQMVDMIAAREWRDVIKECQKYRKEMTSINHPPLGGISEQTFIYAGFVKPGRHMLFIYDPKTQDFYYRDFVVEFRRSDIKLQKKEDQGTYGLDIFEKEDFVFRDWKRDTPEFLNQVVQSDLSSYFFTGARMGLEQDEFLAVIQYIPSIFPLLNEAHKLYLYWFDYPSSSVDKFIEFFVLINLLKTDIDRGQSIDGAMKQQREQNRMHKSFLRKMIQDEQGKRHMDTYCIHRCEWIQKMFVVSKYNYQKANGEAGEPQDLIDYFSNTTLHTIKSYIRKTGAGAAEFREGILWKPNVNLVLKTNSLLIQNVTDRFRIARNFTVQSSLNLLKAAKVDLTRPTSKLTHEKHVTRLFGMSKQTVKNEAEMYFYSFLDEQEIYEWLARVADSLYHLSYSEVEVLTAQDIERKRMSLMPLELKIHELLSKFIAPILDQSISSLKEMNMEVPKVTQPPQKSPIASPSKEFEEFEEGDNVALSSIGEESDNKSQGSDSNKT